MPSMPSEDICSLQNSTVKHCVKVRTQRSYRESSGTVIVSGADLVSEIAPHVPLRTLFYLQGSLAPDLPAERCVAVTQAVMLKITGLESVALGALAAEASTPRLADFRRWESGRLVRLLVLERCQDPGNLGTLLRTALALGWDGVFLLPGCADPMNDKSLRASRGAAFKLPIATGSLEDWRDVVQQHALACVAAEPHQQLSGDDNGNGATQAGGADAQRWLGNARVSLVLGSEGQGLSEEVLQHCTPVSIPIDFAAVESLNVAAAGAILMFTLSKGAPALLADLAAASGAEPARALAAADANR